MSEKQDKKGHSIFAKISAYVDRAEAFLFLFLCSLLILGFVVPTYVFPIPYGTDVYSHLFMTQQMSSANSLSGFYAHCLEEGYFGYDYPFGLWLFGSIVTKITGMGMLELSRTLPFAIMLVLMILYFSYAKVFGVSKEQALLPIIFLLSIPLMCTGILGYSTSVFVESFLIFILYLMLIEREKIFLWKRVLLMNIFIFCLCFTHTGTYMFLLSLVLVFLFIYAALYGDFHRDVYVATASVMFVYIITMHLFPYVHLQYIDKGRILISVGDFISSDLHVPFASELAQMFYEQIFVNLNPLYVAIGCFSIYAISKLLMFSHSKIKAKKSVQKLKEKFLSIPIIGSIRHVSHSVLYTPLWLGPIHVALAAVGVFKTNRNGLCLLFSVAIITLLPGYTGGEEGTGALREIGYFFVVIPVLAALGFYHAKTKIEARMNGKLQKFFVAILLLAFFSSIIILPVVGNLYYHPLISGPNSERASLLWLSGIGEPNEGCAGWGYRHMISAYANKVSTGVTSVASGSEMSRFMQDQYSASFSMNSEKHADDLYATFGVKYLIVSERTMRNLGGTSEQLRIDYNKQLDKIYSSVGYFSIYNHIMSPVHRTNITPQLNFADDALIEDAGDSYLVDTGEYKVRISKATPEILYIGNKTINFFGEGDTYDHILITWGAGAHHEQVNGYVLQELSYSSVIIGNNQIIYKTVLKNEYGTEDWATLTVKYTFFENAMKREIIIANDWVNNSEMNARVTLMLLTPMNHFTFQNEDTPAKKRTVYPCEDQVILKDKKFNKFFINDSKMGIYIEYEKTAPYPNSITYSGLIQYIYEYYSVDINMAGSVSPSEMMHLTQWISVGDEQTAKNNVERYTSVSLYPYPEGVIPIILTSHISSLNTTSEEDFATALNAYEKFREEGAANYTEAVSMQDMEINTSRMNQLLERGVYIIGCAEVEGRNITAQEEKIEKMKENAQRYGIEIKGFLPKDLQYDLDTIKALANQNMTFMIANRIMPAFDIISQEGLRHPQMAYYRGDKTNLVLLPVSEPTIGGPIYFYDDYLTAWKAVIDSVVRTDDLCVFLWDSKKAGMPEHINDTTSVIKYAKEKGMTFTTPYEIANHFLLLQNVSAVVSRSDDESSKITISVSNDNKEPVHGVTFRVELPGSPEYAVNNGQIMRKAASGTKSIYFVSTDLGPKETKEIVLERTR